MAKDLIYYFTKDRFEKVELGEIQSTFNMSFVIDGTKDSAKIEVYNFIGDEIEPYTIIYHEKTSSWWIVSHDKVERYTNESGYVYKHSLQLLGAIELLNSRDLTDCGFNQNAYTIEQFVLRLLKLSNLEYVSDIRVQIELNSVGNSIDLNQNIDYIKTYENYTLLSALNDLFDGYNCAIKLSFESAVNQFIWSDNKEHINKLIFNIISKTGNTNDVFDISLMNEVKETKTLDKNSFGTTIVSNAENVISTKAKTFPSVGTAKLTGTAYEITPNNAVLRLPSKINKVNWVKVYQKISVIVDGVGEYDFDTTDEYSMDTTLNKIIKDVYDNFNNSHSLEHYDCDYIKQAFLDDKEKILRPIILGSQITLYDGWEYNPVNGHIIPPTNNPNFYFPEIYHRWGASNGEQLRANWLIGEKSERDNINVPARCLWYNRGDSMIQGFNYLGVIGSSTNYSYIAGYQYTDLQDSRYNVGGVGTPVYYYYWTHTFVSGLYSKTVKIALKSVPFLNSSSTSYKVNYIPMSDLKIKYDNSGERFDTQLFNQNGKLTDGVALSKRLLSYSKEIESDNITKYGTFYNFNSIPKVGAITTINNEKYVVNNLSIDFVQNENYTYYMSCEFTLSKEIAVKSLMVNPNTNIRDYGIPQNNNVQRKQLYRDFHELYHTSTVQIDTEYYMPMENVANVGNFANEYQEHCAVAKLTYKAPYGGENERPSDTWYYQLDTTTYVMKKSLYEVVNFNDNNIIGYGSQNVQSEFDISRVFTGSIDNKNTPISYVDGDGEVLGFYIAMTNMNNLAEIYQNYKVEKGYGSNTKSITNYSLFIPQEIYNGSSNGTSQLYNGVINTQNINVDYGIGWFKITEYLGSFSGDYNDLSFDSIEVYDNNGNLLTYQTDYYYSFSKIGNDYYVDFFLNNTVAQTFISAIITNINIAGYLGAKDVCDFEINEPNYQKDALEVPVFEYSCQIDDSEDVIVGDNILNQYGDNSMFIYSFVLVPKNVVNNNNFSSYIKKPRYYYDEDVDLYVLEVDNGIQMSYSRVDRLNVDFRQTTKFFIDNESYIESENDYDIESDSGEHDIIVVRHRFDKNIGTNTITIDNVEYANTTDDLMFVIKNTENINNISNHEIILSIKNYKLK